MKTLQFKTTLKCGGCVATLKPILDAETSIEKWEVDITSPEKILKVETASLSSEDVKVLVEKAGFKAEMI
jgi:copper chaperone